MAKKVMAQKENNNMAHVSMSQTYEGPLPTPADFSAYKEALPSAPERIMTMAIVLQTHGESWCLSAASPVSVTSSIDCVT